MPDPTSSVASVWHRLRALALLPVALLAACGTAAIVDRNGPRPAEDESIVVLGVRPGNYRVMLFPGANDNGTFKQDTLAGAVINGVPQDGYIVARAKAGQLLGLTSVGSVEPGLFSNKQFTACGGSRALVFEVPKAKVAYVADIEYEREGARLGVRYASRPMAARDHIRAHYPNLGFQVEPLDVKFLPSMAPCGGGTVYIPIYMGR